MMSNLLVQPENTYWHFLHENRCLQYDDGRQVVVGETLRVEGSPVLCKHGLHASARAIDALTNAPGPIACLVTLGGEIARGRDKSAAQERTVLWMVDATRFLREFACDVAEVALTRERERGRETDPRLWAAIVVMRRFLRGDASESERDTAGAAARAVEYAADAAKAAADAAYAAAARDGAWDAAVSAAHAAYAYAAYAAYAAHAAASAVANVAANVAANVTADAAAWASDTAKTAFNEPLTQRLLTARAHEARGAK